MTARTSRRRVLATAAAAPLAGAVGGCGLLDGDPVVPPPPDPLSPLHDAARALALAYQRTLTAYPGLSDRLTPIAQAHLEHAEALAAVMSPAPGPSAVPSAADGPIAADERAAVVAHRDAERQAAKDAATACRQTTSTRAALVGSIAAARASHAEALQ